MTRNFANINSNGQYVADGTAAITATGPAAASTPLVLGTITNIGRFEELQIVFTASAALVGGSCDYLLQRLLADSSWDDYVYITGQGAATAVTRALKLPILLPSPVSEAAVGALVAYTPHDTNTDATIALGASNGRSGHWGRSIRVIARSGALVTAGAVTNTYVRVLGKE